jgi:hypothetical protein
VADRRWKCSIAVEKFGPVKEEAWRNELPTKAYARTCRRKIHHYNKVADGTETYRDKVTDGRRCVSYGYKKKGGTSVKKCKRWETKYRTVTKTRTRYRRIPVHRDKCRYTIDRYHPVRSLAESGSGKEEPRWPKTDGLSDKERAGKRVGEYVLTLRKEQDTKEYTCKTLEEWKRFPVGAQALVETSLGGKVKEVRLAPK